MRSWNTDAQFATEIDRDYVFVNKRINLFLSDYDQFLLVASKGMGKTLLMRHRRNLIEEGEPSIVLIPQNDTSDYVTLPASPQKALIAGLRDERFWEDLWKLAISISALLHFPHRITDQECEVIEQELNRAFLPSVLIQELQQAFSSEFHQRRVPSSVLDILLQEGKRAIEKTRSTSMEVIHNLFTKYISSACFIFIDSFDQALNELFPGDLDIWCAGQCGLLRAAWELSRHSRHVKVYATFRQEAYASFSNPEKGNMRGSVLLIEYTEDDLRQIFSNAIQHYEGVGSVPEFVGFAKAYNGYLRIHEDVFEYIHRHTIGVPRWLMTIGSEISASRTERGEIKSKEKRRYQQKQVAEIVNGVSADLAFEYLRSEMKMFFQGVDPEVFLDNLISKIHSSVLSFSNLKRTSQRFVDDATWTGISHPFCLLFNLGLLGYVGRDASTTRKRQIFKRPYEFDWSYEHVLPVDPATYYLIHPSVHNLIQKKNYRFNFNKVRIGDRLTWTKKDNRRLEKETVKLFISYSHADWAVVETVAQEIEDYLNAKSVLNDIWLDKWKMRGGKWVQDQILEGLRESDFLILVISSNSLGSNAVSVEWKTKFGAKISQGDDTVFPFVIDTTPFSEIPEYLSQIFGYRYDGEREKVTRMVDDILFWKTEKEN